MAPKLTPPHAETSDCSASRRIACPCRAPCRERSARTRSRDRFMILESCFYLRGPSSARSGSRQRQRERAAIARRAFHAQIAAHAASEVAADRESESHTRVWAREPLVDLHEGL